MSDVLCMQNYRKEFCKLNNVSCMQCTKCTYAGDHTKFWHSFVNIILLLNEFRSLVCFLIVKPLLAGAK